MVLNERIEDTKQGAGAGDVVLLGLETFNLGADQTLEYQLSNQIINNYHTPCSRSPVELPASGCPPGGSS